MFACRVVPRRLCLEETAIYPFLIFQGQAEEARNFECLAVCRGPVLEIERYGAGGPGKEARCSLGSSRWRG
jgi:hypothetical protein